MGIITFWMFKNERPDGPINFAQNYQDCSSKCPEQNGIKNWGVAQIFM
jgi:hypothetical protein